MNLLAFSKNNEYFLFEDRIKEVFKIYKLESIKFKFLDIEQKIFQFVNQYEVNPRSMQIMRYIFLKKEKRDSSKQIENIPHQKLMKHLMICGVIKIND